MLFNFLLQNRDEVLAMTESKSLALAGVRPTSDQLKKGLPIFYAQLMTVLKKQAAAPESNPAKETIGMQKAATENDEPAMVRSSGRPDEAVLAKSAGSHGRELFRLGYTLSHVVHAYGSMCQSITELANRQRSKITAEEFRDLNRCLDSAIAGAVTEYQALRDTRERSREIEHLGFLAHELRNALGTVTMAVELIKDGTVGFRGSTGEIVDRGLKRMNQLIEKSLTEVRLRIDPLLHIETVNLLQLVDQIAIAAGIDAQSRQQALLIEVSPEISFQADQQLIYSAVSNLVQNALKYTRDGGRIVVRGHSIGENIVIEVEDECGGLNNVSIDLFKPFEQQNDNRTGLGLGLTIAQKAIFLNHGEIELSNIPARGCIFKITLPKAHRTT